MMIGWFHAVVQSQKVSAKLLGLINYIKSMIILTRGPVILFSLLGEYTRTILSSVMLR